MSCGIYKITNTITGKVYIGQSVDIRRRWWEHKSRAFEKNGSAYDNPLYRSIRKYGLEAFHFEVIQECHPDELNELEALYIQKYNSVTPNGYNILSKSDTSITIKQVYCKKCGKVICKNTKSQLCRSCYSITARKVERPTKEELFQLLCNNSFVKVGQMYGVSDNSVRKWCIAYGIPSKAKDYKNK